MQISIIYIYIHSVNNHIFIMWSGFPPAYWDLYFRTNTPPTWASACPMGSKGNLRDTSCALLSKSWWKGGEKMVEGFAMVCFHVFILQDGGITCGRMGSCFDTIMCTTVGLLTYLTCDFLGKRSIEQRHVFFCFCWITKSKKYVIVFCHVLPWNDGNNGNNSLK